MNKIKIANLYKRQSSNGVEYFSGAFGGAILEIWPGQGDVAFNVWVSQLENKAQNVGQSNSPRRNADYIVQFGKKYKGQTLGAMGEKNVRSFLSYLEKDGKPLTGPALEFQIKAREFLA